MSWKEIDGRNLTIDQFTTHVAGLNFDKWRPSFIVVHNTGNPSLNPLADHGSWHGSKTEPKQRVNDSLVRYYRDTNGWSAGPHLFIDDEFIWLFTQLTTQGVHSPSWNGTAIGIEMVGDYGMEAFDFGPGAKVRDNAVAAIAILSSKLGLDPHTIKLHKEDPRTTHDCPGKNVSKPELIERIEQYMADGGGEHSDTVDESEAVSAPEKTGTVSVDSLNLREASSTRARIVEMLPKGTSVVILGEAMNGATKWYRIKTPPGWVSARFVQGG